MSTKAQLLDLLGLFIGLAGVLGLCVVIYRHRRITREAHGLPALEPRKWLFESAAVVPLVLFFTLVFVGEVHWLYSLCLLIFFPGIFVRWIFIPLGCVRPAYYGSLAAHFLSSHKPKGRAFCDGLLAHRRSGARSLGSFLKNRRIEPSGPLVGADVLAEALLADIEDDPDKARSLMELVPLYPDPSFGKREEYLALEWLMRDAVRREDWLRAVGIFPFENVLLHRPVWFLQAASYVLSGHGSRRFLLYAVWLAAADRRANYPLLRRALGALDPPKPFGTEPPQPPYDPGPRYDPQKLREAVHRLEARTQSEHPPTAREVLDDWVALKHHFPEVPWSYLGIRAARIDGRLKATYRKIYPQVLDWTDRLDDPGRQAFFASAVRLWLHRLALWCKDSTTVETLVKKIIVQPRA